MSKVLRRLVNYCIVSTPTVAALCVMILSLQLFLACFYTDSQLTGRPSLQHQQSTRPSPKRWIQEPLVVRDRDGRPPRGPPGSVLLLYMCSGSVLLGDLVGVSRSRECDLLSVLLIYPRIFLDVFIVYRLLVGYLFVLFYMLMCVSCFG